MSAGGLGAWSSAACLTLTPALDFFLSAASMGGLGDRALQDSAWSRGPRDGPALCLKRKCFFGPGT